MARQRTAPTLGQIGARLRAERVATGLSQEAAAASAAIGYKHWQEIEGGRANPTLRTLVRIAEALDVTLCTMLCPTSRSEKQTLPACNSAARSGTRGTRRPSVNRPRRSA